MSGLAANETRLVEGAMDVRIGEGRTAEVLRNLCYNIHTNDQIPGLWDRLVSYIDSLFGVELGEPEFIAQRGEIAMSYRESGVSLDLSCSGRGLQQTLLLLAYLYTHPKAVLLLDEPDAHLEILRQRQIYQILCDVARENGNQIIAASHSEVLLTEAAQRDVVIAFVGQPHRIGDRGSQLRKALMNFGWEEYYQAHQTGWVLYLEGASDLAILRAFAEKLKMQDALKSLERPFVKYILNQPVKAQEHFHAMREALPDLCGIALFDRLDRPTSTEDGVEILTWRRREIENYFCTRKTLDAFAVASAENDATGPLFVSVEADRRLAAMHEAIEEVTAALAKLRNQSPWDHDVKVSDEFLDPLFREYYKKLDMPNLMAKKNFHELARFVPIEEIASEVKEKLDAIARVAESASPMEL
jgi:hypothetical protein